MSDCPLDDIDFSDAGSWGKDEDWDGNPTGQISQQTANALLEALQNLVYGYDHDGTILKRDLVAARIVLRQAANELGPPAACRKGGAHQWGTDGQHSNEFCKKCFATKP